MKLKGAFETASDGTDLATSNCFAFHRPHGAFYIVRYKTDTEHAIWDRTKDGDAAILFNSPARPEAVCRAVGAVWTGDGFTCASVEEAKQGASYFGVMLPEIGERPINFRFGRGLTVEADRVGKEAPAGWGIKGRRLVRSFSIDAPEDEGYDHIGRHLVSPTNEDAGWEVCRADGNYGAESKDSLRDILTAELGASKVTAALSWLIKNPYTVVNEPFAPAILPGRRLNRGRQLIPATTGRQPSAHGDLILDHAGSRLDDAVRGDEWCIENNIRSGADYFRLWLASKVQRPSQPLPYLFFYGEQDSGKSAFHRAAGMLFEGGATDVYQALVEQFNQAMAGALIGVIEERSLPQAAYSKLKAWVDSPTICHSCDAGRRISTRLPNFVCPSSRQ